MKSIRRLNGIYFDSMEWNSHNDLNYRGEHFKYTNYPLTFSKNVDRPAIWNSTSEFEMMKNDTAFTRFPYRGYEIYFEKLLAYGFFLSFFRRCFK